MNSKPLDETAEPVDTTYEPVSNSYEDSLEGMLQYHADLSLWYLAQSKAAKTNFKREYYKKKQVKNNQKLYKLLVRTPNSYNPLMKYLTPAPASQEGNGESVEVTLPSTEEKVAE